MEEKESPVSGSPAVSAGTDPPPPPQVPSGAAPQVMSMATSMSMSMSMSMERTLSGCGSGGGGGGSIDLLARKKRGRPRKYDSEGNLRYPTAAPSGFSFSPGSPPSSEFSSSGRRGRGRPPGSGNWQLLASLGELFAETAGGDFTPHVVTVNTGEDVACKIISFTQKGPRGICVLSANGAVSNVTIRQPGSSGGFLTYEGRFEILSLSGSFTLTENGGVRSRTGGLSVSLAGPDGRVIGGGLAGLLTAASPIQIVVGTFIPNGYKVHKRKQYREHTAPAVVPCASDTPTVARPMAQAALCVETCPAPTSPFLGLSDGGTEDSADDKQSPNARSPHAVWNGLDTTSDQKPYPDINVSVHGEYP